MCILHALLCSYVQDRDIIYLTSRLVFTSDRFAWRQAAQLLPLLQFARVRVTYFSLIYCLYHIWRRRWKCLRRLVDKRHVWRASCCLHVELRLAQLKTLILNVFSIRRPLRYTLFLKIPRNWESHTFRPGDRRPPSHAYYSVTTTLCKEHVELFAVRTVWLNKVISVVVRQAFNVVSENNIVGILFSQKTQFAP